MKTGDHKATQEIEGQCCEACNGEGENYCEYAHAMRTCPECMGTGVVDSEQILDNEITDRVENMDGKP